MEMSFLHAIVLCVLFVLCQGGCASSGISPGVWPAHDYSVIDTGLEQSTSYGPGTLGAWLDDVHLLVNVVQEIPGAQKKWLPSVVIFDTGTQKSSEIASDTYMYCFHRESRTASITEGQADVQKFIDRTSRFVKLDLQNKLSAVTEQPPMDMFCHDNSPQNPGRLQYFLRPGDGYVDYGKTAGGASLAPAILYRPDKEPVELSLRGGALYNVRFVPHLDMYQVDGGNYRANEKNEFKLMTRDGRIVKLPRPDDLIDAVYPPAGRGSDALGEAVYRRDLIMRDGVVLAKTGSWQNKPGMYFIKNGQTSRFDGADGYVADRFLPSPDGCKLAYLYMKNYNFGTKKTVKIADLCTTAQ